MGELLRGLHRRLVHVHASLDEAFTIDHAAHLGLLHEVRGMIDAIQADERFRVADERHDPPKWPVTARD